MAIALVILREIFQYTSSSRPGLPGDQTIWNSVKTFMEPTVLAMSRSLLNRVL